MLRKLKTWLKDNRGVAAVEFAIIVPVFLFAYLAANYVSSMSVANRKLQQASYALGNMAPYPREYCAYRDYTLSSYVTGYQRQIVSEMMAPFSTANQDQLVRYEEDPPQNGLIRSRVRMIYDFRVSESEHSIYRALDNLKGLAPNSFKMGVISPDTVLMYDGNPCPTGTALQLVGPNSVEFSTGHSKTELFTASGGVPVYGWAILNPLHPGLTFSGSGTQARIMGSAIDNCTALPCDPITSTVSIRVEDATDKLWYDKPRQVVTQSVSIRIIFNLELTATNETGTATISFVGQRPVRRGGKASYSFSSVNLPPGLSIDAATGVVSGVPTMAGSFNSTIQVTDARGITASAAVRYDFAPPPFSMTVARSTMTGQVGVAVASNAITPSGGLGTITVTCSGLPLGLSCGSSPSWAVQGTPQEPGTGTITIVGKDQAGQSVVAQVSYSFSPPALGLANFSFTGTVGQPRTVPISASGGWGTMTAACSGLPAGMSCAGMNITGTPTVPGSGSALVRVTDQWGQSQTATVTWTIASPAISISWYPGCTLTPTYGTYGCSYFYASGGYGALYVCGYSGIPNGYSIGGGPNLWYISGTAYTTGSGVAYISICDGYGQSATYSVGWYFAPPPLTLSYAGFDRSYYMGEGALYNTYFTASGGSGSYRVYSEWQGGGLVDSPVFGGFWLLSWAYSPSISMSGNRITASLYIHVTGGNMDVIVADSWGQIAQARGWFGG